MPTTNPSPRIRFQWKYFDQVSPIVIDGIPNIVNIGCADDPVQLDDLALHVDIDDWSYKHTYFHQADAHDLPGKWARQFELVILGDILEHVVDPMKVIDEAARVTAVNGCLVMTVFEEWRLPGPGQWIEESHKIADKVNQEMGYEDREDYQRVHYPKRVGVPDDSETPHLSHINQFTDEDMNGLVTWVLRDGDFRLVEGTKAYEQTLEGHDWYNWLFAFERLR